MFDIAQLFPNLSPAQLGATALIFVWSGFVRTGLGFGGAALGLPFLLLLYDQPLFWIPVIGLQLLLFSGLTLSNRLHNVDWSYLRRSGRLILPAAFAGVFGLLNLPNSVLLGCIYGITLFYALLWVLDRKIESRQRWVDQVLLVLGGYVAGSSLTGAPLMIAVFMRHVALPQLRDTLFVLWFIIVAFKLATLVALGVPLNFEVAAVLVPAAAIGHWAGLRAHDLLLQHDGLTKRVIGLLLILVSLEGLWQLR
jgi:uncharacterized membrane protein YfcA